MSAKNFSSFENLVNLFVTLKKKFIAGNDLLKDTVGWTGKNLLQIPSNKGTATIEGITFTFTRDSQGNVIEIDVDGTATADSNYVLIQNYRFPIGTYIISRGGANLSDVQLYLNKKLNGSTVSQITNLTQTNNFKFNIDYDGYDSLSIGMWVSNGKTISHMKIYPMLRDANISDDTYEPYHDSMEVMYEEELHGVNVIKVTKASEERSGVTYTNNGDNTVTVVGEPSANVGWTAGEIKKDDPDIEDGKTYIIDDGGAGDYSNTYFYINGLKYDGTTVYDIVRTPTRSSITLDFSTYKMYSFGIYTRTLQSGQSYNKLFKIMMYRSDIDSPTFHPYNPKSIQHQLNNQTGFLGVRNLLPRNYADGLSKTMNEVTWTVDSDGCITANGTATGGYSVFQFARDDAFLASLRGKFIVSFGDASINNIMSINFAMSSGSPWYTSINNTIIELTDSRHLNGTGYFYLDTNQTANNFKLYPMLRPISDPDDTFVKGSMTNAELTDIVQNGSVTLSLTNPISAWTPAGVKDTCAELVNYMKAHKLAIMNVYDGVYDYTCYMFNSNIKLICYNVAMTQKREVAYNFQNDTAVVVVTSLTPVS